MRTRVAAPSGLPGPSSVSFTDCLQALVEAQQLGPEAYVQAELALPPQWRHHERFQYMHRDYLGRLAQRYEDVQEQSGQACRHEGPARAPWDESRAVARPPVDVKGGPIKKGVRFAVDEADAAPSPRSSGYDAARDQAPSLAAQVQRALLFNTRTAFPPSAREWADLEASRREAGRVVAQALAGSEAALPGSASHGPWPSHRSGDAPAPDGVRYRVRGARTPENEEPALRFKVVTKPTSPTSQPVPPLVMHVPGGQRRLPGDHDPMQVRFHF